MVLSMKSIIKISRDLMRTFFEEPPRFRNEVTVC